MLEKIKNLILNNKLYTGIIAGTVALCIIVVAVCLPMMSGPQLPTSDPTSSGASDLPEPTDPDEPSVPDSSGGDVTSGTDGATSTTRGQSNSSTSSQPTSLSKPMNKIGNTLYKADSSKNGYDMNSLVGVDALGRTFSTMSKQNGKQVGMFFAGGFSGEYAAGNYDCTKILAMENGLKLLTDPKSYDPEISPVWQPHWWSEPIWGYYNQLDTWVVYRQLQMLAMANVDYICFDVTNTLNDWYADFTKSTNSFGVFMRAVIDLKKQGWDVPEVMFMTHSHSIETVKFLYKNLYKKGLYKDAWYYYKGKPLIAAYSTVELDLEEAASRNDSTYKTEDYTAEERAFFSFKESQWPQESFKDNGLPWMEWTYPAKVHNDTINVTTAAHPAVPMSFSLTRKNWLNWGRGYDPIKKVNVSANVAKGSFYQATWDTALKSNASMVFIGEWNEWCSSKQMWDGEYMLCDEVNEEYSRDIEPMKGGFGDNFYMQTIQNIRKFKGVDGKAAGTKKTIDINKSADQWKDVSTVWRSIGTAAPARDSLGLCDETRYTQAAARNNLQEIKAANDGSNLYLYIRTEKAITDYDGKSENWMNVFVGTGTIAQKGWNGFEFVIGRKPQKNGTTSVEKLDANGKGTSVGTAQYTVDGNVMQVKIPLSVLGSAAKSGVYVKAADGIDSPKDIMDYYISGKTMPYGRMAYQYGMS